MKGFLNSILPNKDCKKCLFITHVMKPKSKPGSSVLIPNVAEIKVKYLS